jgi:predicted negative regulator of RcsB-dependent stress response
MEFLYFIGGLLLAAVTYGIFLLKSVKLSYNELITQNQSIQNQSSIINADIQEKYDEAITYVGEVSEKMKEDNYSSIITLSDQQEEIKQYIAETSNALKQLSNLTNKTQSQALSEIAQLKVAIKAIQQGNLQSRY